MAPQVPLPGWNLNDTKFGDPVKRSQNRLSFLFKATCGKVTGGDNITTQPNPPVIDPYVFAWGNPLVSDPAAYQPTATAFKEWAASQNLRPIWSCVDREFEHVLAEAPFNWSAVSCIYEDVIDPEHIVELTSPKMVGKEGGASVVKDLKKNLKRAEREHVEVAEVRRDEWSEEDKRAVDDGINAWKNSKSGVQIASVNISCWTLEIFSTDWDVRVDELAAMA